MTKIHQIARKAEKDGVLIRPESCERCSGRGMRLVKHHKDYSKPLKVNWLCYPCHKIEHAENPDIKNPDPAKGTYVYVSEKTKKLLKEVCKADCRTQDGEIKHLCRERIAEIESKENK